ncbi:LysM peptidoglycan-binding domain-containing M23 family metallopeptidase [Streptomyces yaanensis]|uniref:LysM peptidoglycan-binding domain-containing M23 family metallopeptidase n=1 Tax=Streptomyces yaanensis TaxID=1142239 RepID=A0ABV7SGS9_9ACTN|nr:LysM peptidoglycan-binding domain-containing M23 family metallopeptidase [Streptomyces sp. CGMCC 4.7035]WNB99243.1 LysM peptidoglycan-binding domain-containing M23 family metallopeptidase [Streptomyces sp. CGMCC 4.7035]
MPAQGKHRRPKSRRFIRSIAVVGTGGAAFALPLMGAAGAHAATPAASVSEKVATVAPVVAKQAPAQAAGVSTYTVKAGDWLAKIADEQHVSGGWQKLYQDNRSAVGSDPSLIHPGLKLTLGGTEAAPKPAAPYAAPKASQTAAPKAAAPKVSQAAAPTTTTAAAPATSATGYTLPVQGRVGTAYHVAGSHWASGYHTGVDFVVPTGTSLKAVGAGTVVSAGWGGAYGNQVVIKLADGYYAQYAHLSKLSVSAGQTVTGGQQIGLSGATGNVTGPHLHFEIRTTPNYGSDVSPLTYLRSHGVAI